MSRTQVHPVKLRRQLGGSRAKRFHEGRIKGAEFYNQLAASAAERIKGVRGRPSADWDMRRLVPVRRSSWELLGRFGKQMGLSAGQLAALLMEDGLKRLGTEPQQTRAE